MRRASPSIRLLLAAVLTLWLGVRLLTPAGFMPSFESGSLAIVECPGADLAPPPVAMPGMAGMAMPGMMMPEHHHHDSGKEGFHHSCPYAPSASLAGIDPGAVILVALLLLSPQPRFARALPTFRRQATRDRPPSQGPPLPA